MTNIEGSRRAALVIFLLWLGFGAGFITRHLISATGPHPLLVEAEEALDYYYYGDPPSSAAIERGLVAGLVEQYDDPHTNFVEPVEHELQTDELSGEYGGIGAFITRDEDGTLHVIPFENSPAAEAGIVEGDILLQVDEHQISAEVDINEVISWIRGPVGQDVGLTLIAVETGEEYQVTIERQSFAIPSVTGFLHPANPTIGVLRISIFSDKTAGELLRQLEQLQDDGAQAFVLDLRDNGGGLLTSAVDVVRIFLTDGLILTEKYKGNRQEEHWVDEAGPASDLPLAVLVNGGTASAAEIVAGAIQRNARAELFGSQTYGKGSVQVVVELSDGSSLFITSARWFLAGDQAIEGLGLTPDYNLEDLDPDGQLLYVVEYLVESLDLDG